MQNGDVVFGKRPLSFMGGYMSGTSSTDNLNMDIAHEHVFYKTGGKLYDIGFDPTGTFREPRTNINAIISSYKFGPTLHHADISAMQSVFDHYKNIDFFFLGPNCQDFSEAVREKMY